MLLKKVSPFCLSVLFYLLAFACKSQTAIKWSHFDAGIFTRAKKENKLVLLHLRANWCHWCHVMEEKTYTDKNVLACLEKNYISCMEDHDERQDLTSIYAEYGWPATVIFDANGNELYKEAGYIPADEFLSTLQKLKKNPEVLANDVVTVDSKAQNKSAAVSLNILKEKFRNSLDTETGGFSFEQKYIDFETFEYALLHYKADTTLKKWLVTTVTNSWGLYDNEWGGVYQYSTDGDWQHVHYEKLLFIQARYIKIYCWYFKIFNDTTALKKAEGIVNYVNRFLSAPGGGFYNAQDADLIKGEKAHGYFALKDADRIKMGIPAIDSNVYTSDNAQYAESLAILWAATEKKKYLSSALKCIDFILKKRKLGDTYLHGEKYILTVSLKDNITVLKTLLLLYRASQTAAYKTEAAHLLQVLITKFYSGKGYFYTYIGKSAIKSSYNISENIALCRLFNYAAHVFNEPAYKVKATEVFNFLTNAKLVATLSAEPGILSASEEIIAEPITATLMIKNGETLKTDYLYSVISFPHFYFNSAVYTKENIIEDKKDLFETFNENFIVLCTSSYCSSPMLTVKDFSAFLYKRALDNK